MASTYKRILLKLSGESLMGGKDYGIDNQRLGQYADEIIGIAGKGVQVAVVIGGGNIYRGMQAEGSIDRVQGDHMGMLATVINSLALQSALEAKGHKTRLMTAIKMEQIAEPFIRRRAVRHLEKGRVVIFGAGAGMPFFSTDTVAAQRALETHCEVILMGKYGVDGMYTADPRLDPTATRIESITYAEALARNLKVADATAFALCMENAMPMIVFGMEGEGNVVRAVRGERIGTLVSAT